MAEKKLNDLFLDTLKDIYFAERQIIKNLPKMAKAAKSAELKKAFLTHREQTEQHIERLQEVFELIGRRAQAKTCEAIKGILEEGEEIMEEYSGSEALDAGLLAAAQALEHYEMSRYGTLKTWAGQLGLKDAVSLLDETFQEEKETDALLSGLAESSVNQEDRLARLQPRKGACLSAAKSSRPKENHLLPGASPDGPRGSCV